MKDLTRKRWMAKSWNSGLKDYKLQANVKSVPTNTKEYTCIRAFHLYNNNNNNNQIDGS